MTPRQQSFCRVRPQKSLPTAVLLPTGLCSVWGDHFSSRHGRGIKTLWWRQFSTQAYLVLAIVWRSLCVSRCFSLCRCRFLCLCVTQLLPGAGRRERLTVCDGLLAVVSVHSTPGSCVVARAQRRLDTAAVAKGAPGRRCCARTDTQTHTRARHTHRVAACCVC